MCIRDSWYALQSMTTKTVLILGGKDKGNDYTEIEDLVREKCSALVYLGLHNEKLQMCIRDRFGPLAARTLGDVYADTAKGARNGIELAFDTILKGRDGLTPVSYTHLIEHCNSFLDRQSATWTNLCLKSLRQGNI